MNENTGVSLNFQAPNISTVVYAVQNDKLSRHIVAQLRDGSAPWTPPAGASAAIRYLKPDGTAGFYDVDEAGNDAITISGSVATLTIAEQAITVPGDVYMQLNFYTANEERLTTFSWILRVQKSVIEDAEIVSSDYFNALTEKIAQGIEVAQQLTFPVPITNGGTGADNAADARSNLGLGAVATENVVPVAKGGTAANNASDARANLGLGSFCDLAPKTEIPSNSDFNDYKNAGTFYVYSDAIAHTISNIPRAASGTLLVINRGSDNSYLQQFYFPTSSSIKMYTRMKNDSTWTSWSEISANIFTITGTVTTSAVGTSDFAETYNSSEYMCLSCVARGAVSAHMLIPYKYGDAEGGRWGFKAVYSGTMNAITSTEIAYEAVMMRL